MQEQLITPDDLANFAPDLDLSQYNDTTVSGIISRASARIINYCQVAGFAKTLVTSEQGKMTINPQADLVISFKRRPVQQGDIQAIRLVAMGQTLALTLSQPSGQNLYIIPEPNTYMVYPSNFLVANGWGLWGLRGTDLFYQVDYVGGYDRIPDDIKEACTLYCRDIIARRYNPAGAIMTMQGRTKMQFGDDATGNTTLVKEAQSILDEGGYPRQTVTV